jgi:hypothetical protein
MTLHLCFIYWVLCKYIISRVIERNAVIFRSQMGGGGGAEFISPDSEGPHLALERNAVYNSKSST